jgi:hypothetical protein
MLAVRPDDFFAAMDVSCSYFEQEIASIASSVGFECKSLHVRLDAAARRHEHIAWSGQ